MGIILPLRSSVLVVTLFWLASFMNLDDVAFLNVGLCATVGNQYPGWMLRRCFSTHSGEILRELAPDLVLLSGSGTYRFEKEISSLCPKA